MTGPPAFLGLQPPESDLATASAVVIPVPYDQTSTWKKGADRGPDAILAASTAVELFDIPTATQPWRRGIATLAAVPSADRPEAMAERVRDVVAEQLAAERIPVVLGGEHSVSIGAIRAAAEHCPDLTVLQVDAHADTRESYEGSALNHACVMARAREVAEIVQVGIRSVDAEEVAGLDPARVFWAHDILAAPDPGRWISAAANAIAGPVYLTVDLDGFDPAVLPATGTPEPGGLSWHHVESLIRAVARRHRIVAFDVVELLPHEAHWASDFLAAKLVYRTLAEIFSAQR